ncbi:hypothetical protein [Campylobacter devanensis]|nr:hypothetical protein [Campylobacter sp. P0132]
MKELKTTIVANSATTHIPKSYYHQSQLLSYTLLVSLMASLIAK